MLSSLCWDLEENIAITKELFLLVIQDRKVQAKLVSKNSRVFFGKKNTLFGCQREKKKAFPKGWVF